MGGIPLRSPSMQTVNNVAGSNEPGKQNSIDSNPDQNPASKSLLKKFCISTSNKLDSTTIKGVGVVLVSLGVAAMFTGPGAVASVPLMAAGGALLLISSGISINNWRKAQSLTGAQNLNNSRSLKPAVESDKEKIVPESVQPRYPLADIYSWPEEDTADYRTFELADKQIELGAELPARGDCQGSNPTKPSHELFEHLINNSRDLYLYVRNHPEKINQPARSGLTLLQYAAIGEVGSEDPETRAVIRKILFSVPDISFDPTIGKGDTPLHIVAKNGASLACCTVFHEYVNAAIQHGFNFRIERGQGETVLQRRIDYSPNDVAPMELLKILVDKNLHNKKTVLNVVSSSGSTALSECIRKGFFDVALELLELGADPKVSDAIKKDKARLTDLAMNKEFPEEQVKARAQLLKLNDFLETNKKYFKYLTDKP